LIRARDVEAAQAAIPAAAVEGEPLSRLRQAIAVSTQASKQTVPHFYLLADVDMGQVQTLRSYCTETMGWSKAPTYTAILVRAAALALIALPECNVSLVDRRIVQRAGADVGVVVGVPGGLLTPVIAHADRLSLAGVSARLGEVTERARGNRLRAEDLGGKSLVISNLGMYTVDSFIAIIEQPAPMILAVGRITDRVVAVNGQPAVRPICTLTLSADHRVLDGIPAAQFLTQVVRNLEQPFAILGN
jgi:pyruvate dehydrogenase E2 component (dihydrolipoamide acetyltransferase)